MDESAEKTSSLLVLAIDDNEDYCNLLSRLLKSKGHKLEFAQTAKHGLEVYERIQPDLVLLDFELPDMSGAQCLKQLRAHTAAAKARIVVFSGHDVQMMKPKFEDAMPDAFVQKPIDLNELAGALEQQSQFTRAMHQPQP